MTEDDLKPTAEEVRYYRECHGCGLVEARNALIRQKMEFALASMEHMDPHVATLNAILKIALDRGMIR